MKLASGHCALLFAATFSLIGWNTGQAQTPASYIYTLMVNIVGPAADSLWVDAAKHPIRDEDWQRLRQNAAKLMQSTGQVSYGGTSEAEEQRATSRLWQSWADRLSKSVSAVNRAVNDSDQRSLLAASDDLHQVCAGCHAAFPPTAH